jgi:hypothetical protein
MFKTASGPIIISEKEELNLSQQGWVGLVTWLYENIQREEDVDKIVYNLNSNLKNFLFEQLNLNMIEKMKQNILCFLQAQLNNGIFFYQTKLPEIMIGVKSSDNGAILIIARD